MYFCSFSFKLANQLLIQVEVCFDGIYLVDAKKIMHLEYVNKRNFFKEFFFFFKFISCSCIFYFDWNYKEKDTMSIINLYNITFKIINYNFRKNLKIHQEVLYLSVNLKKKRRKKFNII